MADRKKCLRVSAKKEEALNLCLFGSGAINLARTFSVL